MVFLKFIHVVKYSSTSFHLFFIKRFYFLRVFFQVYSKIEWKIQSIPISLPSHHLVSSIINNLHWCGAYVTTYEPKLIQYFQLKSRVCLCVIHTHTHTRTHTLTHTHIGFPGSSEVKESAYNVGAAEDEGSVPGWGRSPGGGHGNLLQYSCLGLRVRYNWSDLAHRHTDTHTHTHTNMCVCVCMTTVKYPKLNPLSFLFHATLSISLYSFCCYPYISSSSTTIWLCLLIYSPPFLCLCLACYSSPSFFVSKVNILGSGFILLRFKYWLPLSGCVLGKFCCGGVPSKWDC